MLRVAISQTDRGRRYFTVAHGFIEAGHLERSRNFLRWYTDWMEMPND